MRLIHDREGTPEGENAREKLQALAEKDEAVRAIPAVCECLGLEPAQGFPGWGPSARDWAKVAEEQERMFWRGRQRDFGNFGYRTMHSYRSDTGPHASFYGRPVNFRHRGIEIEVNPHMTMRELADLRDAIEALLRSGELEREIERMQENLHRSWAKPPTDPISEDET